MNLTLPSRHSDIRTPQLSPNSFLKQPTTCVIEKEYYRTMIIRSHLRFCCLSFILVLLFSPLRKGVLWVIGQNGMVGPSLTFRQDFVISGQISGTGAVNSQSDWLCCPSWKRRRDVECEMHMVFLLTMPYFTVHGVSSCYRHVGVTWLKTGACWIHFRKLDSWKKDQTAETRPEKITL